MEYTNPTGPDDERPAEVAADVPPTLQALDILIRAHVREAGWTIQAGQGRKHYQPNGHATLLSHGVSRLPPLLFFEAWDLTSFCESLPHRLKSFEVSSSAVDNLLSF